MQAQWSFIMEKRQDYQDQIRGLTQEKLEFLCQPSQIETTLKWLWCLNSYQKQSQKSTTIYPGKLQKIKEAILRQAYQQQLIQPVGYLSGLEQFLSFFRVESIAQELAEGITQYLEEEFPHLYQMPLPPLPSQGWKGLVGLTVATRLSRWLATEELPGIPELDAAWILLGNSREYHRLAELGMPAPDTFVPSNLASMTIPAWQISTVKRLIEDQAEMIAQIDAETIVIYEQRFRSWEEKLIEIEQRRSQKLISIADILGEPVETIHQLLATGEVERRQLEQLFQRRIQELRDQAIITVQPMKTELFRQLHWPLVVSLDFSDEPWDDPELEQGLLKLLDPEGFSYISFEYQSPTAHFIFQVPFRSACQFIPWEQALELRLTATASEELGESINADLSWVEIQDLTLTEVLVRLGIEINPLGSQEMKGLENWQPINMPTLDPWVQMPVDDIEDNLDVDWDILEED